MLQHFLAVSAALLVSFWATVTTQYQEFRVPPSDSEIAVETVPLAQPTVPTPLETVISDIVRAASSTPSAATTTPIRPAVPTGPVTPQTPKPSAPLPVPVIPTPTPVVPAVDAELSDEALLKAAIVNIICVHDGGLRGVSGSGIIVDSRGIIMTVAHVAQNFLLRDYPEQDSGTCYIRTGSPAKNAYAAEPIYISPSWLEENSDAFLSTRPKGTGEHDFAFLAITRSLTGTLPSRFPAVPLAPASADIEVGDRVGTGSYAAEFLTSSEVRSSLYPTIKFANIDDVYTFGRVTTDLFSVAAGSAAQEGSSGGAVMNGDDRLIGLITTRTVKPDLALRTLQALTMDHARSSFRSDTGENLDAYLRGNLPALVAAFEAESADLLSILTDSLSN